MQAIIVIDPLLRKLPNFAQPPIKSSKPISPLRKGSDQSGSRANPPKSSRKFTYSYECPALKPDSPVRHRLNSRSEDIRAQVTRFLGKLRTRPVAVPENAKNKSLEAGRNARVLRPTRGTHKGSFCADSRLGRSFAVKQPRRLAVTDFISIATIGNNGRANDR